MKSIKSGLVLVLVAVCAATVAAEYALSAEPGAKGRLSGAALEAKVDSLLQQMTIEEKVGLCAGDSTLFGGVPRLKIPNLVWTDGARGPNRAGPCTAFPAGVAMAATWNPDLLREAGQVMGNETRASGAQLLLGPSVNLQRDPLGGRFFEYYTEDPYLNGRVAVAIVQGLQSEGVGACVKHYACNNREENRNFYMSIVDPRTLHEIYLPAFKAAVEEGHMWAIMTSANGINGEFVSDSKEMLGILRDQWKFDGMITTDWLQTRSTEKAALAGLDVSMPGGKECGFGTALLEAVKAGKVPESVIDAKARHVLRLYGRVGLLDGTANAEGAAKNTPAHETVARQVAQEGIVLLKNDKKLLPLDAASLKKVLVIGPSADRKFCRGGWGGSAWVESPDGREVTPLAGLREALGDRVEYLSSDELGGFRVIPAGAMRTMDGKPGFGAKYYAKDAKEPAVQCVVPQVDFMWEMKSPDAKIPADGFRAEFEGKVIPPVTGTYTLRLVTGGMGLVFNEDWGGAFIISTDKRRGIPDDTHVVTMEKGKPYYLKIQYWRQPGDASVRLEWQLPEVPETAWAKLDAAAKAADAVVFVGGIDHSLDTEGHDRADMKFPAYQERLIHRLAKANPKTVVVLVNGSPLEIGGWLSEVPAVVEAWYSGMEGGHAIADVLTGRVNPSGRLPFSWPRTLKQSPSRALATQDNLRVNYTEGLMIGYRYFDTMKVDPQFPFGYGLSYTTFEYGPLELTKKKGKVLGALTVKNTGDRDGLETVQIYVRPISPSVSRPVHELKAFKKVSIPAGQSQRVEFELGPEAFSYYDVTAQGWTVDAGEYEIQAGASSRDIRAAAKVAVGESKK